MKVTDHFRRDVVGEGRDPKYEGITYEACVRIVRKARYTEEQGEERLFWGYVQEMPGRTKWLKVVTDARAESLITAYKDRRFARKMARGGFREEGV